jgi:hypothetical protein
MGFCSIHPHQAKDPEGLKPFLGIRINTKLQEGLDRSNPLNRFYFQDNNPEFLQIVTVDQDRYIGKFVEQGAGYTALEDICRNIISIMHKLCPDIAISIEGIRVLALTMPSAPEAQ